MINSLRKYQILLASKSPRRRELLESAGYKFEIVNSNADETVNENVAPGNVAEFLAVKKANGVERIADTDEVILAADTVVIVKDEILGKPVDEEDAERMLRLLSGISHEVITGICLKSAERLVSAGSVTRVCFKELSDDEINYYVKNYRVLDKAGAYGIQDWIGKTCIEKIEGDYWNVVGLPMNLLYKMLSDF